MVSARDLGIMRAGMESLMPDTCTIKTPTGTTTAFGFDKRSYASEDGVACRVERVTDQVRPERVGMGAQPKQEVASWAVTLPWDTAVSLGCLIVLSTLTLEIVDVNDDKSWKAAQRVLCNEVRSG